MSFREIVISVGIPSILTSLIIFLFRRTIGTKIDTEFKKKLEEFKSQIAVSMEYLKFDIQRKFHDFSLYATRKHEAYLRFHELLLQAESNVRSLYGLRSSLTYEEHNINDVRRIMETERFPEGKIEEIITAWRTQGKNAAIKELREYLRLAEFFKAERSINELQNHFWKSNLYFSDEIEDIAKSILGNFWELFHTYKATHDAPLHAADARNELATKSIRISSMLNEQIKQIMKAIKYELTVGYYNSLEGADKSQKEE